MSAKQAINDKLQGSVAACLRCSGVVNNRIKTDLLLSQRVKKILRSANIWQSYQQERDCLVHFLRLVAMCWPGAQSAWDNHVLACNFAKYSLTLFFFAHRLSNKPFLIWLLTTPAYLKYVATLPCNKSLMACFADINVSKGSVPTYERCGWIFNFHLSANLARNLPATKIVNRLRFDKIVVMSLWPSFFGPPCRSVLQAMTSPTPQNCSQIHAMLRSI